MAKTRIVPVAGDDENPNPAARQDRREGMTKQKGFTDAKARGSRKTDKRSRGGSIHESRQQQARGAEDVHEHEDAPWVQPSTLPQIPARPGFVQRWIRVSSRGTTDPTNIARKFREGWQPRQHASCPKSAHAPKINRGEYAGCVGVEGMVLCEMPKSRNAARNAHYRKRNERQTAAIDEALDKESRHGSTAFGRIQKVEKSKLVREVNVAADE